MIYCIGSINLDHVYQLENMPRPGETLAATGYARHLGGKGVNQTIAALRAGGKAVHIGAIGADDRWVLDALDQFGVGTGEIARLETPTGHAIIFVDAKGENEIVIFGGANQALRTRQVLASLADLRPGDWVLFQNETNDVAQFARAARDKGAKICYSAAPFARDHALEMLDHCDLLAVNEEEARAVSAAAGRAVGQLGPQQVLVTRGAKGASLFQQGQEITQAAFGVEPVDTTGAGDTFLGSFMARQDLGDPAPIALRYAAAASAVQVTRHGAAAAIPTNGQVTAFLNEVEK